jgi:hypothetical protein
MKLISKANGNIQKPMERDYADIQQHPIMRVNGLMAKSMAMVQCIMRLEMYIKDNGARI